MFSDPVAEQDWLELLIPIIVAFIHDLHQGVAKGLVKSLCEPIGLGKEELAIKVYKTSSHIA